MTEYVVEPLDVKTWDAFARLVERNNGVFGGCWCTWFHTFHSITRIARSTSGASPGSGPSS
ncbi:MAG TPA: hypothetical protein VLK36_12830 [Gaiellaceae bacterium]|nr:hypothetical protein [Gaiellaceae bacterium]